MANYMGGPDIKFPKHATRTATYDATYGAEFEFEFEFGFDFFAELSPDLAVIVFGFLTDRYDRVRACLALPRVGRLVVGNNVDVLGWKAQDGTGYLLRAVLLRELGASSWQVDDHELRAYAARDECTPERYDFLASVTDGIVCGYVAKNSKVSRYGVFSESSQTWGLAAARIDHWDGELRTVEHYEGPTPVERLVRVAYPNGGVEHFYGGSGDERLVRSVSPNGYACDYEGDRGVERLVRLECSDGRVCHYDGERGAERIARVELSDGLVCHCQGERGSERVVLTTRLASEAGGCGNV